MLETIREYAAERLQNECEDSEILKRRAGTYVSRRAPTTSNANLRKGSGSRSSTPNWRTSAARSAAAQEHDKRLEVDLAAATWFFLAMRGLLREIGFLVRAIEMAEEDPSLDRGVVRVVQDGRLRRCTNGGPGNASSSPAPAKTLP